MGERPRRPWVHRGSDPRKLKEASEGSTGEARIVAIGSDESSSAEASV